MAVSDASVHSEPLGFKTCRFQSTASAPVLLGGPCLALSFTRHLVRVNSRCWSGVFPERVVVRVSHVSEVSGGVSGVDGTLQSLWCLLHGSAVLPKAPQLKSRVSSPASDYVQDREALGYALDQQESGRQGFSFTVLD